MVAWLVSPVGIASISVILMTTILSRMRHDWRAQVAILVIGFGALAGSYKIVSIPLPASVGLPSPSSVYDVSGRLIGTYSDVRRFIIDTTELPAFVNEAVLVAEDRDFFSHRGLSVKGMLRAAWSNLSSGRVSQGGSTIDQQYVKIAILHDSARTVTRKIKEAVMAVKLNQTYSKREILNFYLNTVYFGRGAYGIEAASRTYFGHQAASLKLSEAAFLAGIIRAPEAYQPDEHPKDARSRRDATLNAMADERYITRAKARALIREPLRFSPDIDRRAYKQNAAYFMEWLRREYLAEEFGECLYTCGLKIYTTLDLDMQRYAEEAVAQYLPGSNDPQAALVAMTPGGEVRAMVGGREFRNAAAASGFNLATDLPGRHAGSAFKPFTLLTALNEGISTQSSLSGAGPRAIDSRPCGNAREPWLVENFGGMSYGTLTLDQATSQSVNTAYADLIARVGPQKVARLVAKAGFARTGAAARTIPGYCSLALGSLDVTPLEMARAYAGFAGRGVVPPVVPIIYIADALGSCLKSFSYLAEGCEAEAVEEGVRIASTDTTETLNLTLSHVIESGTGIAAAIGRPAAGKTGTSQNFTDAWFTGYVPQLASAVWVGYPAKEGSRLVPQMRSCRDRRLCRTVDGADVSGGTIPARIWAYFMRRATQRYRIAYFTGRPSSADPEIPSVNAAREDRPPVPSDPGSRPTVEPEPSSSPRAGPIPLPLPIPTRPP